MIRKIWFDAQDIIDQLEQMFQTVDYVFGVGVIGGEPLIYKDLDKILKYLCRSRKVGYIVIVTNGTIYPSKKIIQYMKHPKVITWVSIYTAVAESENRKRLLALLEDKKQGINHKIFYDLVWTDMGQPRKKPRRYSEKTIRQSFDSCWLRNCSIYIEGVLYRCNRCYGIIDQGISESGDEAETIDFKKINGKRELKKRIREFYGLEYVKACYWCNDISHRIEVKAGVQLNDN